MLDGIAFTGTQQGMTDVQSGVVTSILPLLFKIAGWKIRHGDCIGADEQIHRICRRTAFRRCFIHIHPPSNKSKCAFCEADAYEPSMGYLERNHAMVDATSTLLATPKDMAEELRSGTWATVRYARKRNRCIYIVYPDGTVRFEHGDKRFEVDLKEWLRSARLST